MSDVLREVVLIAATMRMGLMAGVFGICGNTIIPGLAAGGRPDLRRGFRSIDRAIINPAFMATFVGALALAGLAALLQLAGDQGPLLPWIAAAFVLYLVVFVITIGVNVPRSNEIKAAGDIDQVTDPYGVRERSTRPVGLGGITYGHSLPPSRSACSPGHLSCPDRRSDTDSFVSVAPGKSESAGRVKSTATGPGNTT